MNEILTCIVMCLLCISNLLQCAVNRKLRERIDKLESELTKLKIRTECIRSEMHMKTDELAIEQIKGE